MDTLLDLLWLRIPPIRYVCPPVCEVAFSGSGSSTIILEQHPTLTPVQSPTIEGSLLCWVEYPGAICYTVYRSEVDSDTFEIVSECNPDTCYEFIGDGCFRVSAITPEGETPTSKVVCTGGETPIDPEVSEWADVRVPANGGSVSLDTKNAANVFLTTLKNAGLRSKILRLNLIAGNAFSAAQVPLIIDKGSPIDNPFVASVAGSGSDFTYVETGSSGGLRPLTANAWLNTGFIPDVDFSDINASGMSFYSRDSGIIGGTPIGSGIFNSTTQGRILIRVSSDDSYALLWGVPFASTVSDTDGAAFYTGSRIASNSLTLYRNAVSVATESAPGGALHHVAVGVFGMNRDVGPFDYSTRLCAGYAMHTGFTGAEETIFYNAWQVFQASLNRQV